MARSNFSRIGLFAAVFGALALSACTANDATVVSTNLSTDSDNFKVPRRVVLYNGITDQYIQKVEGFCSLQPSTLGDVAVVCKTDFGYVKHIWKMGDNVTVFVEQLDPKQVSSSFYTVVFKPSVIIPNIEIR